MLRGTNDSCSPLRHTFYSIANPERRTCHNVLFIAPPHVTPAVNLPRYYTPTPRLFFISSPPVDLSLDFAVSGFVCVCLSLCSSVLLASSERDAIVMNASVIKAMRENHPLPLKHPFKTILGIHTEAAYDGLFWGKDTV